MSGRAHIDRGELKPSRKHGRASGKSKVPKVVHDCVYPKSRRRDPLKKVRRYVPKALQMVGRPKYTDSIPLHALNAYDLDNVHEVRNGTDWPALIPSELIEGDDRVSLTTPEELQPIDEHYDRSFHPQRCLTKLFFVCFEQQGTENSVCVFV